MATVNGTNGNDSKATGVAGGNGDDLIYGFGGADDLEGDGGDDVIYAGSGADRLRGGRGDDQLDGGAGADRMEGGEGDDTYVVEEDADVVRERAGEGIDTIKSFVDYQLGANLENLELQEDTRGYGLAKVGVGNALNNSIKGNSGDNDLYGAGGDDGIAGGRGDDVIGGGAGDDVLNGGGDGALGDEASYLLGSTGGVMVSLALTTRQNTGGAGFDTLRNFENLSGSEYNDSLTGDAGANRLTGLAGADTIFGGAGADTIFGGLGDDTAILDVTADGADRVDLGTGSDVVTVNAATATNVRLTFTSAEVGNGNALDGNAMANQDGGLAVRFQGEDGGTPAGPLSRFDDEGQTFVGGAGVTFDVRDLVSGAARGELFEVVTLGTNAADTLTAVKAARPYYINAGQGADTIVGGTANDFLVGGAGDDVIDGGLGNDSFIGGGGADVITGGADNDTAIFNVTTDGADRVDLGTGSDVVTVNAATATNVRLTFTSAEVGNGNALDGNAMANQDGGLAVRLQGEDGGTPTGPLSRFDDEGQTFVGGAGVTFDVRDLVSGAARGELFEVVTLGTNAADTLTAVQAARPYYINAGQGADTIVGGTANDFLVGGAGDDVIDGGLGNDSFIGGGGADVITGGADNDTAIFNVTADGADRVDLGTGSDVVTVNAATATNVRLTFTSAEVGNGNALDGNAMANQDGGLAVRFQGEDGTGTPTGPLSRFDDEGQTFVGGAGVTFDVRDLVSGAARGELFEVVTLGTNAADTLTAVQAARPYYINAGQGADTIVGGIANDFLVGGAGDDVIDGGLGNDSFIGGGGADVITGGADNDTAIFNVTADGADRVDLGTGSDVVTVNATTATNVRLTFTSAEVGNGNALDGNAMANQDGGLAVRFQGEDGTGTPTGPLSRFDDEGQTFVGGAGVTFDVRDLVSGAARGELFEVVTLGTNAADTLTAVQAARPYYINAGQGADTVTGGTANDFLVGGAGDDVIDGGLGNDSFIGGGGADAFSFSTELGAANVDLINDFVVVDDTIRLDDAVFVGLATGALSADAFVIGAAADDDSDRIVYDSAAGRLLFDVDGSGAASAVQFAALGFGLALSADDFIVT